MHTTTLRVRFGETDVAGHVNNAVYLSYLEEARIQFLQDALNTMEVPLILASAHLDFLRQVFFPDVLTIQTGVYRFGNSSFDLVHQLYRAESELALSSTVTLVYFDYEQQKPARLPEEWRAKLSRYWTDPPEPRR